MSEETNTYSVRAANLRRTFDQTFTKALATTGEELESVIAFSVGGDRFAVRLNEICGMAKSPKVVPVPNSTRALLGLAGIRGELLPIYCLCQLLDYTVSEETPWLLVCGKPMRIGLGINEFFGCFRTPLTAFSPAHRPDGPIQLQEVVVIGSTVYTVISISSLTKLIRNPMEGA